MLNYMVSQILAYCRHLGKFSIVPSSISISRYICVEAGIVIDIDIDRIVLAFMFLCFWRGIRALEPGREIHFSKTDIDKSV